MSAKEASDYISAGYFAPGSMLPKVEAAVDFVSSCNNCKAVITHLDKAKEALLGRTGTTITQ